MKNLSINGVIMKVDANLDINKFVQSFIIVPRHVPGNFPWTDHS
jgi:hypothetical protein